MKTIPDDFDVNDDHRNYCAEKWGHPRLPDTYITDFKSYWLDGEGEGKRKKNWDRCFTNWIRRDSPLETTRTDRWEAHLQKAKQLEGRQRQRKPLPYNPRGETKMPKSQPMPDLLRNLVDKLR